MASMKLKAAYVLFLSSFFVWFSALLLVCFPSGVWSFPIRFPNYSLLMFFLGSGIVAGVSCAIIGLNYLGLNLKSQQRLKETLKSPTTSKTIPILNQENAESTEEAGPEGSLSQREPVTILVPELEEEQENK